MKCKGCGKEVSAWRVTRTPYGALCEDCSAEYDDHCDREQDEKYMEEHYDG